MFLLLCLCRQEPQLLVRRISERGEIPIFELVQQTVELLEGINRRVSVVSIAGPYRTGKSWLMNRIMNQKDPRISGTYLYQHNVMLIYYIYVTTQPPNSPRPIQYVQKSSVESAVQPLNSELE